MKLVVDNLAALETVAVRTRPLDGYRAAGPFAYDFTVALKDAEPVAGKAGQFLVIAPDGSVSVVTKAAFAKAYQRTVPRAAKPKGAAKS